MKEELDNMLDYPVPSSNKKKLEKVDGDIDFQFSIIRQQLSDC